MAKFGFAPLERAAQTAREKIGQQIGQLADAAQRQRAENVYYREGSAWRIVWYVLGAAAVWLAYSNMELLRDLIPMGIEFLTGLLPEGIIKQWVMQGLSMIPRFQPALNAWIVRIVGRLAAMFFLCLMIYGVVGWLGSLLCEGFASGMDKTGKEMQRRLDSIGEVQSRLQDEAAGGFQPLRTSNPIGAEARKLIEKSERILRRNRLIRKMELLLLLVLTAAVVLPTLIQMHRTVILMGLQGRNEALLVTIVTILTLSFYVCFAMKRLYPVFPKLGKWFLRIIVLGYAVWLNVELIVVQKQVVDIVHFFLLDTLPIPQNIAGYIVTYGGPVLLSLVEVGSALGIVNASDPASERKADKEGLAIPMTDGTTRVVKPGKARRMGAVTMITPLIWIWVCSAVISMLLVHAVKDISMLALTMMSIVVIFFVIVMSMQGLSNDRFELKYKRKGAKLQRMLLLVFLLAIFALCPGDSILLFHPDFMQQMEEQQQQIEQQQEEVSLGNQVSSMMTGVQQADRFSCEFTLVYADTGEPANSDFCAVSKAILSVDRQQKLAQITTHYPWAVTTELQDYSWPAEGMESYGAYKTWGRSDSSWWVSYIEPDGEWNSVEVGANQWVEYNTYDIASGNVEGYSDICSFMQVCSSVKALEELGTEEIDGITATHYVVSVEYQDRYGFIEYDAYGNPVMTHDTAESYYSAMISDSLKEHKPEECAEFMDIVDRQYNANDEIHLWVDGEGRLVQLQMDWTFEYYRGLFQWNDDHAIAGYLAEGLSTVWNVQKYRYDDLAAPMVMPDSEPKSIG